MAAHPRAPWRGAPPGAVAVLSVLVAALAAFVIPLAPVQAAGPRAAAAAGSAASGYWMVGSDGKVYPFGAAADLGSPALPGGARATHVEPTPDGGGYYVLDDRGDVFGFGHAAALGNAALAAGETAVSLSSTPSGQGYWIFTSAGRVITKGDATNLGDMSGKHLNAPVVSSTVTPDGSGYWMVAGDGGVFSFGAPFWGSTGNLKLNKPVEGIVPTATDKGYWLVASDGGVFAFGDAGFKGSMGSTKLNKPVVGLVRYGDGYLMVASDGGIFDFSNLAFQGSLGDHPPANPIVGTAAVPGVSTGTPGGPGDDNSSSGNATSGTTSPTGPTGPAAAQTFSNTARASWGTPLATDPNNPSSGYGGAERVNVVREDGAGHVFVGGEFTNLVDPASPPDANGNPTVTANPPLPYVAELDVATGAPTPGSAFNTKVQPDGAVYSLAVSADGQRLYLAGDFTKVDGQPAAKLAAVDIATGALDPTFRPPTPSGHTRALLLEGNTLYVGGAFLTMGNANHALVAALDAHTGALLDSFGSQLVDYGGHYSSHAGTPTESTGGAPTDPGVVHVLALTGDAKTLLVGGDFVHLGTSPTADPKHQHGGLVALDPTSGTLTPWQPLNTRPTFGLAASPTDGQTFYAAEGGAGGQVLAFHVGGPTTPKWTSLVDGDGIGVAATPTRVYFVGHFQFLCSKPLVPNTNGGLSCPPGGVTGIQHNHLAAYDPITGATDDSFTAAANTPKGPDDVYLGAHDLYVGGDFSEVAPVFNHANGNFRPQPGLAVFPASS